jgi:hypothetical protein
MSALGASGGDLAQLQRVAGVEAFHPAARRKIDKGALSLPVELVSYLNKPNGRSVLIKGKRRVGKTNLALALSETLSSYTDEVLLLLTYDLDKKLIESYPWVGDKKTEDALTLNRPNTPDAILQAPSGDPRAEKQKLLESVRRVRSDLMVAGLPPILERPKQYRINTERISRLLALNPAMTEIINLYDAVERMLPNKVVIIIDRIDTLARKYGIEYRSLAETLQRDLVRGANCDLLMIQERDDNAAADRAVDGVVVMRDISRTEDFLGEIAILNLADVVLKRSRSLYRFEGGRVKLLESATVGSSAGDD